MVLNHPSINGLKPPFNNGAVLWLGPKRTEKIRVRSGITYHIISGPGTGQVYLVWIGEPPQYLQLCLREYADW